MNIETILLALCCISAVLLIVVLIVLLRPRRDVLESQRRLREEMLESQKRTREELTSSTQSTMKTVAHIVVDSQQRTAEQQELRFKTFEYNNEQKLEQIRETMERRINSMQADNNQRLEEMRQVVDEKLQKTLENKMSESFRVVNESLEKVFKGLGEMQTLANGVGDLKKVLSNVKRRGILGEVQLYAILSEILSPEQFEENVVTKAGSSERVEFAIKLPADDGQPVLLPIDSKFPGDLYSALQDAYESSDAECIRLKTAQLVQQLKKEAKDIHDKYIDVPNTTDFAILFLPFEGLYAEVVNQRGLVEELQSQYHVNIAGPSTMAALLNSIQMGFRTVAIQKRSAEVWQVLGAVKTEFEKFGKVLEDSQKRLNAVNEDLDNLIGKRTRSIVRKLQSVERMGDEQAATKLLDQGIARGDMLQDPENDD